MAKIEAQKCHRFEKPRRMLQNVIEIILKIENTKIMTNTGTTAKTKKTQRQEYQRMYEVSLLFGVP